MAEALLRVDSAQTDVVTGLRLVEGTLPSSHGTFSLNTPHLMLLQPVPEPGFSTARSLRKYMGTWNGDDLEECLDLVYRTRGKARF